MSTFERARPAQRLTPAVSQFPGTGNTKAEVLTGNPWRLGNWGRKVVTNHWLRQVLPGFVPPGQRTTVGTRMPPS